MIVKWMAVLCALVATTMSAGAQTSPAQVWPTRPVMLRENAFRPAVSFVGTTSSAAP